MKIPTSQNTLDKLSDRRVTPDNISNSDSKINKSTDTVVESALRVNEVEEPLNTSLNLPIPELADFRDKISGVDPRTPTEAYQEVAEAVEQVASEPTDTQNLGGIDIRV